MWDNAPASATDHWFYPNQFLPWLYRESYIFSSTRESDNFSYKECY